MTRDKIRKSYTLRSYIIKKEVKNKKDRIATIEKEDDCCDHKESNDGYNAIASK